jgi:hypothetical protein
MSSKKDATKIINKKTLNDNVKIKVVETDSDNDIVKDDVKKSNNNENNKVKNLGGRPKREDIYKVERQEVLDKLNKILGITNDNNKFFLWDIDNNDDIKKSILELQTDVEKYFRCSGWNFFSKKIQEDRKYMSLIRSLYKEFNFELYPKTILITRNNQKIKSQQYAILKSNNN